MSEPKLFHLLHMSHRAIFRAADRILMERFDITAAQNAMLLYLNKNDGATMSAVAAALGLKNAATSGLVDRMAKKRLVERRANARDGRVFELHLLPAGRDIVEQSRPLITASNERMMEGFSKEERTLIAGFLETVIERADAFGAGNSHN